MRIPVSSIDQILPTIKSQMKLPTIGSFAPRKLIETTYGSEIWNASSSLMTSSNSLDINYYPLGCGSTFYNTGTGKEVNVFSNLNNYFSGIGIVCELKSANGNSIGPTQLNKFVEIWESVEDVDDEILVYWAPPYMGRTPQWLIVLSETFSITSNTYLYSPLSGISEIINWQF